VLEPFPGVRVDVRAATVELDADVCLDEGWLEQIACGPGTREHESLMVPRATPSQVHAALLAAGHRPGRPGRWERMEPLEGEAAGRVRLAPPSGSRLRISVRVGAGDDAEDVPVAHWIRDHLGREKFPDEPWVFGGSHIEPTPEWMREDGAGPEHYVADMTGSIIGLVTFGDEVIGFSRVLSDSAEFQAPEWEADTEHIPPVGTPVVIVIRPWQ
jgi:hypothetical protein